MIKLRILSRLVLLRCKPYVIGITGSIGKTSAKEALELVLSSKYRVRSTYKNYNNEIGLPLTIIGSTSKGKNIFSWFLVFIKAIYIIIFKPKSYPDVLVLEMGVDKPGDLDYLCKIAKPSIGIVTSVSYAHIEFFGSLGEIKKEKEALIRSLDSSGTAILNYDNELSKDMSRASKAKVLSYGIDKQADLVAQDIKYNVERGDYELIGINYKLNYKGSIVPVFMKNAVSKGAIYAGLAAAAVALELDLNLVDVAKSLESYSLPRGRMNVLSGINNSFIIDDSYNSSPEACISALNVLASIKLESGANKYAVLGDMLEIGSYSKEGHRQVGEKVAKNEIDYLYTIGNFSEETNSAARKGGLKAENIRHFSDTKELSSFLVSRLGPGDVVLVKGSQGMRMERVVKELIIEKERASELLVRQEKIWS